MKVSLSLCLPRDTLSVPVTRRVLRCAMTALGVTDEICNDVEVAVTEACNNVIRHAEEGEEYEVCVGIEDAFCIIDVLDTGRGWDADQLGREDGQGQPELMAERGRGLHLIHALTDNVRFTNHPR